MSTNAIDPSTPCSSPVHKPIRTVRRMGSAQRLQKTHGFHHDRNSGGIVRCAFAKMPGVEVRAKHDEFVALSVPLISPTTLKDVDRGSDTCS